MVESLKDLCMEVESVLIENNIAWRYTSTRDVKNLLLEDGYGTIINLRYVRKLHKNVVHIIGCPMDNIGLSLKGYVIQNKEHLRDIIIRYL